MKIEPHRVEAIHSKLVEIANECTRALNMQPMCPFIVVRGHFPVAGWPRGKCIGSDSKGRFYSYDARKLLAAIAALGVVSVEVRKREDGQTS